MFVKSVRTNQGVDVGIKKTDVKRVTFQETRIEDCDPDDDIKHQHVQERYIGRRHIQPWVQTLDRLT